MHLKRNGVGDLVPGWYPVPQNPLNDPTNSMSNPIAAAMQNAAVTAKSKGVGDLVTGNYPVPFNPIVYQGSSLNAPRAMMCDTSNALASSVASMTAGPTESLSGFELATRANLMGLGQVSADQLNNLTGDVTDILSGTTFGYPNWMVWGGAALAAYWLFGSKREPKSSRFHRATRSIGKLGGGGGGSKK